MLRLKVGGQVQVGKFSISVIANEYQISQHVHSERGKLALHRFLEQCNPLEGERWQILGDYRDDAVEIRNYRIQDIQSYSDLEIFRTGAYQIFMEWVEEPIEFSEIQESVYEYLIRSLSDLVRFISWDKIKNFLEMIFERDLSKRTKFRDHIDDLRKFSNRKNEFSDEVLNSILAFDDNIENSLSSLEYCTRYLDFSVNDINSNDIPEESERIEYLREIHRKIINILDDPLNPQMNEVRNNLMGRVDPRPKIMK